MTEGEIYVLADVTREYPHLDKWFSEPTNLSAQISSTSGHRFLSAQEKLAIAGGVDQVKQSLGRRIRNPHSVILAACGMQPMVITEVRQYQTLLTGRPSYIGATDMGILVAKEELEETGTIVYISRQPKDLDHVWIRDRRGYKTTDDKGLLELSRRRTTSRRDLRLFPQARPQGI